jgi:predicted ATPase
MKPDRLGTGYGLNRIIAREVPEDVLAALLGGDATIPPVELEALPMTRRVLLKDSLNGVQVTPHDVGVGLSQLIPVVVAALDRSSDLLLVEQPELHIHPRVQVGLGDLFLEASREYRKNFLIETHSEAMLLRMMKRVRQTQDDELPAGLNPAHAEDVAVCLLQNEGQGVTVTRMQMNRRGEFIKPWPKGLFEESLRETF